MRKFTLLVAAMLATAGVSAQSVQKWAGYNDPDATGLLFPWSTTFQAFVGESEDVVDGVANSFVNGNIALFNDEVEFALSADFLDTLATTKPTLTVSTIEAAGVRVNNSKITYTFMPAVSTDAFNGSTADAALVKEGDGALYTDVANNMPGGTIVKGGTVARKSKESASVYIFGKNVAVEGEGTIDFGNLGSTYASFGANVQIPEGSTLNLYPSRYTYMTVDTNIFITGAGTLNFYARGERAFLGGSKCANPVDFSGFSGKVNFLKDPDASGAGWYGPIMPTETPKGKSDPASFFAKLEGDSMLYNVWQNDKVLLDSLFYDMSEIDVFVGAGADLACESAGGAPNVAMIRMKSLNMDPAAVIRGYYKASNPQMVILFGDENDCQLAGTFTSCVKGTSSTNGGWIPYKDCGVGLFKEGKGTAYITSNENMLSLGIEVWEGRVLFNNNDINATATGANKVSSNSVVTCRPTGTIGGYGTIGGHTSVMGTLQPGSDAIGTLRIDGTNAVVCYRDGKKDAAYPSAAQGNEVVGRDAGSAANLLLYKDANIEMEVINAEKHDQVLVQNEIRLFNDDVDGQVNIKLSPRDNWSVNAGDSILLLRSKTARCYIDGKDIAACFNMTAEGFGDATFAPAIVTIAPTYDTTLVYNEETFMEDTVITQIEDPEFKLYAVVTAAGSGSAEPDAIESVEAETLAVAQSGNVVTVSGVEAPVVEVYTIAGAQIAAVPAVAGEAVVTLPAPGTYVVKAGKASKVVLY
ncbi:MAG: hypothetical protein IJY36_02915 [Coprobacter sp.]|nr:hypothetical protein [Coprobacter sp.]